MTVSGANLPALLPSLLSRLWAFAMGVTGDEHNAEVLVYRACVRALERADKLQPDTCALNWMFSIIHSIWINELRGRHILDCSLSKWDENLIETVIDPHKPAPDNDLLHRQILYAVNGLPENLREIMLLVAIERFSYQEASEILNLPISTVIIRFSCARQAIVNRFTHIETQQMGATVQLFVQ